MIINISLWRFWFLLTLWARDVNHDERVYFALQVAFGHRYRYGVRCSLSGIAAMEGCRPSIQVVATEAPRWLRRLFSRRPKA